MDNLLRAERFKLVHRFSYWIGLGAMLIFGFLSAGGYMDSGKYWGVSTTPVSVTSFSGLYNSMAADSLLITVIVTGILALMVGQEFHKRTVSSEVSSGHNRRDIFLSKVIVNAVAYNIIMVAYPLSGTIKALFHYGSGNLLDNLLNILRTSFYMFLSNSAIFVFAIMIAFLIKNGVIAGIVTTVLCLVMTYAFALAMSHDITAYNIVFPFYHFRKTLEIGSSISGGKIISIPAIIVCVLWMAICGIIMWSKFAKSDLK